MNEPIRIEIDKSDSIFSACQHACQLAELEDTQVIFDFNGVNLIANSGSLFTDIAYIYNLKKELLK